MRHLALLIGVASLLGLPPAARAEDLAALCAEASARYQELFGHGLESEAVKTVLMYKYRFCPSEVRVKSGEKLRYVNVDKRTSHSVWLRQAGQEESPRLFSGEAVDVDTALPPGTYEVLCGPHWESDKMIGTLVIEP